MKTTADALIRISRRAERQHGVITRSQILEVIPERSLSRFVERGLLRRARKGVYHIATRPLTWRGELLAAAFRAGEKAVASHRGVAPLWRLTGFEEGIIEVTSPHYVRPFKEDLVYRRELPVDHVTKIGPIPVTTVARTLFDLASLVDEKRLGRALDDAIRQGRVTLPKVIEVFRDLGGPGRKGSSVMRRVLEERDPSVAPTDSDLEVGFLRLVKRGRLPKPVLQYEIRTHGDRYFIDFAYPEAKLAVEVLGYAFHSPLHLWRADKVRHNVLENLGWRVLYFTWDDVVNHPRRTIQVVAQAITGDPRAQAL